FPAGSSVDPKHVPKYSLDVLVSGNFFSGLQIPLATGRGFLPDEDTASGHNLVAVISYQMWDREFGRNPAAVGHLLRLNGTDFTIVGVAAAEFTGPVAFLTPDIYVPIHSFLQSMPGKQSDFLTSRQNRDLTLLGRLKPGARESEAQAELATIAAQLA